MSKIYINTDGGSRGNPGPAGIGVVFFDESEKEFYSTGKFIGNGTNNEAEYNAIIYALEILLKSDWFLKNNNSGGEVVCRLDSQLVVEQINGNYKVKQDHLRELLEKIKFIIKQISLNIKFVHVRREQNKRADELVNIALDAELKKAV